jgi:hypothetical protein
MSKIRIVLMSVFLVCALVSSALAVAYPDALYVGKQGNVVYVPVSSPNKAVTANSDAQAVPHPSDLATRAHAKVAPPQQEDVIDLLGGMGTSFNVNAAAQSPENEDVNQAQVSASFQAYKGPFNFTYTHSRNYYRSVDAYFGTNTPNFEGVVNNQVTVGFSFQPDFPSGNNAQVSAVSINQGASN